jgi:ABC-type multidrug transport system fused ATPase/permease subunit
VKNVLRILSYFHEFRKRVLMVIAVGSASIIMFAFMPQFLNNAFNDLRHWLGGEISAPMFSVIKYVSIFGVLALFNALFDMFCTFVILKAEHKIIIQMSCEVKRKLDVVPASFVQKFSTGDLSRRVMTVTPEMITNALNTVYSISRVTVFFITTTIMMFSINWALAIVVVCSLPICIIVARFVAKRTTKYISNFAKAAGGIYTHIDRRFSLQDFYSIHGLGDDIDEFTEMNKDYVKRMVSEETTTAFNTIYINYIQNFMYLLVTLMFGILYVTQVIPTEFGMLPAFIMYSNRFLDNAVIVTTATNLIQRIAATSPRIFEILDCPDDVTEREHREISHVKQNIVFDNVSLCDGADELLRGINFTIPQGSSAAFVGPAASGKSHIVDLLAKLATASGGTISVDGTDINEITSKSYYKCVGVSLEKPFTFRGTVAENLLYGVRRELPENVMAVTEKLGMHAYIEGLENGYETWLLDNAPQLGTGQKQGICVARLVLQKPDIAVFHESLSATDTVTEKNVYEKISKMHKKQTTIFVTHRLSSVEHCDKIYYMEQGEIIEQGTHRELMSLKGKYYRAYIGA